MRKHICGVPDEHCTGSLITVNKTGMRAHQTPHEAFRCYRKYLLATGHREVGTREFVPPAGGPIRVLTKPSHFGAPVRLGKRGTEGGMMTGSRMTYVRPGASGIVLAL